MRWLIRIIYIILFVALVFIAISFLSANAETHQLSFLNWTSVEISVGATVLISFVLGALLGLFAGLPLILGLRRQIRRMQKKVSASQAIEINS